MLQALQSVISLLLGAGILILGNGLVGIVLPVRMSLEHVPTGISGLVMSAYYGGLVLGCLWSRDLIVRDSGHHFEPEMVSAFCKVQESFRQVSERMA